MNNTPITQLVSHLYHGTWQFDTKCTMKIASITKNVGRNSIHVEKHSRHN